MTLTSDPAVPANPLIRTCLYDLHVRRGGRLVGFGGYELPVRYAPGPVAEHMQTRTSASLFDVSHMGVVEIFGPDAPAALEKLVPAAIRTLGVHRMRYTMLTNDRGGVIDDLMVTNDGDDHLTLVVNAGCKAADALHLRSNLPAEITVLPRNDLALLALQGPLAVDALQLILPGAERLAFLEVGSFQWHGQPVGVSRSGYTGEDGFELTVSVSAATALAEELLDAEQVEFAGLAARDSLRLEAGLCLYGHDLTADISPVEAGLAWTIQPRRRAEGGFPGAERMLGQIGNSETQHRVGLRPEGRKPIREDAALTDEHGIGVGVVTSGGFGPTVGGPIAMGYVAAGFEPAGTLLHADVRGVPVPCRVTPLPFVPHRYHRKA